MTKQRSPGLILPVLFSSLIMLSSCFPKSPTDIPQEVTPAATGGLLPTAKSGDKTELPAATEAAEFPTFAAPPLELPVKDIAGVHLHYPLGSDDVSQIDATGANWTRVDFFFWDEIEPVKVDPPVYDWSVVDEENIRKLAESGIALSAVVLYTPEWAQKIPGVACGPIASAELPRFASFMRALVERYSQSPYKIKFWEIGNEPDIDYRLVSPRSGFGCWGDAEDPGYGAESYAAMLKAVYPAVKSADPEANVLVGGLLMDCDPVRPPVDQAGQAKDCTSSLFLESILKNGGGDYFDGVSFHAYDYYNGALGRFGNANWNSAWNTTGPAFIAKARYLRSLLTSQGYPETPLYLTELATVCGRDGTEDYCLTEDLERTKAIYLLKSILFGQMENLDAVIWFGLQGWRASGIIKAGKPLPIYQALAFYEETLDGAPIQGYVREYAGVQGFRFLKDGNEIWVIWSADGEPHSIELPRNPAEIYNGVGQAETVQKSLEVTVDPIYVIWK